MENNMRSKNGQVFSPFSSCQISSEVPFFSGSSSNDEWLMPQLKEVLTNITTGKLWKPFHDLIVTICTTSFWDL